MKKALLALVATAALALAVTSCTTVKPGYGGLFGAGQAVVPGVSMAKTGEATGVFYYHDPINDENNINEYLLDPKNNGAKLEENVGDMFSSNYLLLRDRNVFDEQMQVSAWTDNHKDYSYRVYHNFPTSLSHVSIEYKNMYY